MKNYQLHLKRWIGISTLTLLVSTGPLYAQQDQQSSQQSTLQTEQLNQTTQQSDSTLSQNVQSRDSSAEMQQSVAGSGREIDEPAGADNEKNWSWLGLLGLLGLFGMKRRHDVHDENYRPLRT